MRGRNKNSNCTRIMGPSDSLGNDFQSLRCFAKDTHHGGRVCTVCRGLIALPKNPTETIVYESFEAQRLEGEQFLAHEKQREIQRQRDRETPAGQHMPQVGL